jgi:hypothetical protein
VDEVWIAIRTDGIPDDVSDPLHPVVVVVGDGTRDNPWDGSTALKLDLLLNTKVNLSNVTIHLGPGVFRTGGAGGVNGYSKWLPLSGWRVVGSGQYQTTLLLTTYGQQPVSYAYYNYQMIDSGPEGYLDGFEISELTLDCGMDDQPLVTGAPHSWPETMCAAFILAGRNIVMRRVRFVNYGTRAPTYVDGIERFGFEGYPGVYMAFPESAYAQNETLSFGQILEDCIFEQPYASNGRECTIFHHGPGLPLGFAKGFSMRRCYFQMRFTNRSPFPPTRVASVIYNSGSVTIAGATYPPGWVQTINTVGPHNVKANALPGNIPKPFFVEISGATGNTACERCATTGGSRRRSPSQPIGGSRLSRLRATMRRRGSSRSTLGAGG